MHNDKRANTSKLISLFEIFKFNLPKEEVLIKIIRKKSVHTINGWLANRLDPIFIFSNTLRVSPNLSPVE